MLFRFCSFLNSLLVVTNAKPQLISLGTYGLVYALNNHVVVKVARLPQRRGNEENSQDLANEQKCYARLGAAAMQASPYIVPVFYQAPALATFMLRAPTDLRCVLGQLCGAVAFLEGHGLVHADLRPDNVLVDCDDNVRLHDLGAAMPLGDELPVAGEPFGRKLGPADGVSEKADRTRQKTGSLLAAGRASMHPSPRSSRSSVTWATVPSGIVST